MSNSQLHHYVPRFLLRRFGTGKKDHLHTCDKSTGAVFSRAAGKLAARYDFYDFTFMGKPMTVEPALADLEAKAGARIARILKERRLNLSDPWERGELARFLAVQLVRTPAQRATSADLFTRMEAWLRAEGMPDAYFAPDPLVGGGDNAERAAMARRILDAPASFGPAFLDKDWVLFETATSSPYLIGDHPLVMHNERKSDLRGTLGLAVEGIEIYFPISPQFTLGMLCPTIGDRLSQELACANASATGTSACLSANLEPAARLLDSISTGSPFHAGSEGSPFFNALQIGNAERYVFSSDGNFDLLKQMLGANPDLKRGRRMTEATGKF
jgi:hypothetical protein